MKGRSRLGAKRGLTKNQKRKAAYAAKAAHQMGSNVRHTKIRRASRLVGMAVHRVPCGNVACRLCFHRVMGQGVYPNHGEPRYPGKVINGVRYRSPEEAQAARVKMERERGITIKAQSVRLRYKAKDGKEYTLNLIDSQFGGHHSASHEIPSK